MSLLDVGILCALITSAKQNDNLITADSEIEAVSGAVIYTYRPNIPAFRRPIAEVTHTSAFDPYPDAGFSPIISQILKPFYKNFGLSNLVHNTSVDYYLHIVKGNPSSLVFRNRTPAKFRSNLSETGKNRRKFPVFGILVIVS
jgi:hypothetical protein